ncbi:MAG: hypothetical protein HYZ73_08800 [Elusimicrobia bacterium]|nr:hypothetical protein [Elusimicrobiota bacterium]
MKKGIPLEDPGDYLLDPSLAEIKRRRRRTRAHLLGIPLIEGEQPEEPPRKHKEAAPAPEAAPADQLLTDMTLQFKPGKNNPAIIVSRPGVRQIEQKLPQAEYAILLKLARMMHASGRRRSISIRNWGWVERATLVAIIAGKSHSPENALYYFGTLILRLRRRLVALIREVGGEVEPRRIIDNDAPSSIEKRSLYRLSIHPDNLTLPT